MKTPSETVQAAQRLLAERERVGLAKYGTTVDREDLSPEQWLQHAIEEASDLLLYLLRLQQTMGGRTPDSELATLSGLAGAAPDATTLEEQADADRAAYLARWVNAPEWAEWLCEDELGVCRWSSGKPEKVAGGWMVEIFAEIEDEAWRIVADEHHLLGRVACEPRPAAEGER